MTRNKTAPPSTSVEFFDADGRRRWSACDAPAYLDTLAAQPTQASRPDADSPPAEE